MTTVRIMPKQPIEAIEINAPNGRTYAPTAPSGVHWDRFDNAPLLTADHWHEVTEIVWDGSDEVLEALRDTLPGFGVYAEGPLRDLAGGIEHDTDLIAIYRYRGATENVELVGTAPLNARIRIEGDSFVILPPAKDGAE